MNRYLLSTLLALSVPLAVAAQAAGSEGETTVSEPLD
jgi:hypothetical protein